MDTPDSVASGPAGRGRRTFFKILLQACAGLWSAGLLAGTLAYLKPPRRAPSSAQAVEIGPLNAFAPGQARLVTGAHQPFWVIMAPNREVVALPAVCTHLHCILEWDGTNGRLICPCHLGAFDLNGNVLSGPPPRPLGPLTVTVKGGRIYVYV